MKRQIVISAIAASPSPSPACPWLPMLLLLPRPLLPLPLPLRLLPRPLLLLPSITSMLPRSTARSTRRAKLLLPPPAASN